MEPYSVRCFMPADRSLCVEDGAMRVVSSSATDTVQREAPHSFVFEDAEGRRHTLGDLVSIGETLGFIYTRHLLCLHERELRELLVDKMTPLDEFPTSAQKTCDELLNSGGISCDIYVKFIDARFGCGLFASKDIDKGACLGEYVGVLSSTSTSSSAYTLAYPSSDGAFGINASEYGNIIRFANHSETPNAEFVCVSHCGLAHIVCMLKRDIRQGEEITVDYGQSYWKFRQHEKT